MAVEAAVVQVDGTDQGFDIVREYDFGVEHAWGVAVNLNTGAKKCGEMAAGNFKDIPVVGDVGDDDGDADAAAGGAAEGFDHGGRDDQVGRRHDDAVLGGVDQAKDDALGGIDGIVGRTISEYLAVAGGAGAGTREILLVFVGEFAVDLFPHL